MTLISHRPIIGGPAGHRPSWSTTSNIGKTSLNQRVSSNRACLGIPSDMSTLRLYEQSPPRCVMQLSSGTEAPRKSTLGLVDFWQANEQDREPIQGLPTERHAHACFELMGSPPQGNPKRTARQHGEQPQARPPPGAAGWGRKCWIARVATLPQTSRPRCSTQRHPSRSPRRKVDLSKAGGSEVTRETGANTDGPPVP